MKIHQPGVALQLALLILLGTTSLGVNSCERKLPPATKMYLPSGRGQVHLAPLAPAIDLSELSDAIRNRRERVLEFTVIREEAHRLGLRVWLFGGTAAGYAHYVNWDLKREAGDHRYIDSRFDYDFTSIYRSTQDADLVVDGEGEDAKRLEALIKEKLTHLQGSKDDWEVRLLRRDFGFKLALLNNPDFLEQHSDSNSTGMIEITDPPSGEGVVRDLRDWSNQTTPQFLRDVSEGKLHYYFSPKHESTRFYKNGMNPPIFSVIRYFTKAFQYELEMRDEDIAMLQSVIQKFDFKRDITNSKSQARFEKLGSRLILHASNMEFAMDTLERVGLRKVLVECSNADEIRSMGWWLNREPLQTRALGMSGKTLREVLVGKGFGEPEKVTFAHDTSDFLAYESILRDTTGRPNVLISRQEFKGEVAAFGKGHYTRIGRVGARGTGFTIRYHADLDARLGADFTYDGDYFIWTNRAALHVIAESINLTVFDYIQHLYDGQTFSEGDRGIEERIKRRIRRQILSKQDERRIVELFREVLKTRAESWSQDESFRFTSAFSEWLQYPVALNYPELVQSMLEQERGYLRLFAIKSVFSRPGWEVHSRLLEPLLQSGVYDVDFVQYLLWRPAWKGHRQWFDQILNRTYVRRLLRDRPPYRDLTDQSIVAHYLPQVLPHCGIECMEWTRVLLARMPQDADFPEGFWDFPFWSMHPDFVLELLSMFPQRMARPLFEAMKQSHWGEHPKMLQVLMLRSAAAPEEFNNLLSQTVHWRTHPLLISACRGKAPTYAALMEGFAEQRVDFLRDARRGRLSCDDLLKIENPTLNDYYDHYGW